MKIWNVIQQGKKGMGQGNNFGIEKSKTRYVMILNPDTVLNITH